jgi:hypothetical protein
MFSHNKKDITLDLFDDHKVGAKGRQGISILFQKDTKIKQ